MTTPDYSPNEPQPNDTLGESQPNFLNNFQSLYDAFLKNHVSLDDATLAGKHKVIQLLEQPKAFQTGPGEFSVYSKDVDGQTDQIFMRYQGDGTEFQFTNYQLYALPQDPFSFRGFTFLPGKLLVYFGVFNATFGTPFQPFSYQLLPPIAKNIITMNFCVANGISHPPIVELAPSVNNIFSKVLLTPSTALAPANLNLYYVILANI